MRKLISLMVIGLTAGCGGGGMTTGPSTLSAIDTQTFKTSCEFSSCHSNAGHTVANNLNLEAGAFDALVGKPAVNAMAKGEGKLLVKPGDPDNSFLLTKLTLMAQGGICKAVSTGYGGCMPQSSAPLDSGTIAGIKAWIAAGAQNN